MIFGLIVLIQSLGSGECVELDVL